MSMKSKPLAIPLPGGSGQAPTGAVQFRDDWPGLFIRGDEAVSIAMSIRDLKSRLADIDDLVVTHALFNLSRIADVIERDVRIQ
jgi:hypothetical protein